MADSTGFFGGLSTGLGEGQTQALAEQKQAALEQNQTKTQAVAQVDATIKHIQEVIKANADAGNDPQKVIPAIQPLIQSATGLAQAAGMDPNRVQATVQALLARPAVESEKKHSVVKIGSTLTGDQYGILDTTGGTVTPIDGSGRPVSAQPVLGPSDVITPGQAQRVNAPQAAAAPSVPIAPPAPQEDAALPPGAAPTESIDARFAEPPAPTPPPNPNINLAAIGHLPQSQQGLVKGAADGTVDPTKTWSLRKIKTPDGDMSERAYMLGQVKAYDDSFDMANPGARAKTLNAFKSGVEARKLTALGTVVNHTIELYKDGLKLDNWKSDTFGAGTKTANELRAWVQENKQSPLIAAFNKDIIAVSSELENAFRGNNTAITGIMEWKKGMSPAMSPDEVKASTQKLGSLLLGRMSELKEQWDRGMGHAQDPSIAMKLAKTRELLEKMAGGTLVGDRTIPGTPAAISNPTVDALKSKYGLQ